MKRLVGMTGCALCLISTMCPVCSLNSISNCFPGQDSFYSVCLCVYGGLSASHWSVRVWVMGASGPGVPDWQHVSVLVSVTSKYQAGLAVGRLSEPGVCIFVCVCLRERWRN